MKRIAILLMLIFATAGTAKAETMTLTTYYPAPFGAYDQIRLVPRAILNNPCKIGTMYVQTSSGTLQYCQDNGVGIGVWGPLGGVWTQTGNNIYPSQTSTNPNLKIGIGTTSPSAFLHVTKTSGNVILGQTINGNAISATATNGNGLFASSNAGWAGFFSGKEHVSELVSIGSTSPPANTSLFALNTANGGVSVYGQQTGNGWAGFFIGNSHVSGKLGVGTLTPTATTDVKSNASTIIAVQGDASANSTGIGVKGIGGTTINSAGVIGSSGGNGWGGWFNGKTYTDYLRVGDINGLGRASIAGDLYVYGKVWYQDQGPISSLQFKNDIADLSLNDAIDTFKGLHPVTYRYKNDQQDLRVGFIAEDVPELVSTRERTGLNSMDVVAVLTKVVQHQQDLLQEQKETLQQQQQQIQKLQQQINSLK